jgi:hypothetical protein
MNARLLVFVCPDASLMRAGARWQFSGIRPAEDA